MRYLPRRVLKRLDALAKAAGESRSGYIAHLTLEGGAPLAGVAGRVAKVAGSWRLEQSR
jgi:hypothetical protein